MSTGAIQGLAVSRGCGLLPNWYSFLSLLASIRYRRRVVVLQVLGSFMAVMAAVMASSKTPPFSRTLFPVRFNCDRGGAR